MLDHYVEPTLSSEVHLHIYKGVTIFCRRVGIHIASMNIISGSHFRTNSTRLGMKQEPAPPPTEGGTGVAVDGTVYIRYCMLRRVASSKPTTEFPCE